MNFLNPLLLLGLLAGALPIVIHLINRRRAVRRTFPAMEFLRRSQKQLARRLKIRHLLLLALRVAALLLIPLALAKPYLLSDAGSTDAERLPSGIVYVVDDSASMDQGHGGNWDKAVGAVRESVGELRTWDRVGLVYASAWPAGAPLGEDVPLPELVDDHGEVLQLLEDHRPAPRGTDLVTALKTAGSLLAASDMPQKRIVLVTDRQLTGLDEKALAALELNVPVQLVDVRGEEEEPNVAIVGAEYHQQSAGNKPEFEITATVRNFGATAHPGVELSLLIDGEHVATSVVDAPAAGTVTRTFTYQFANKGLHRARFQLGANTDSLAADNVYHFPIHLASKVRALLVNGDRRNVPYQDELFYLEHALQPSQRSTSSIVFDTIGVEGLAGHPFENYDVVVLANVEKVPRASLVELQRFVERGGGLFISAGDKVDAEAFNTLFASLLPKPLRSVKLLTHPEDPDAPVKLTRVGAMDRTHPVFKVFDLPGGESINSVQVYSYMLLEPTVEGDSRIVLSYGDGAPALLERAIGEGRVAFWTTTLDRDWTDLPIRTAFLPLMRRYLRYLARRGASGSTASHIVGQKVSLEIPPDKRGRIEVRDPDGGRIVLTPESTDEGAPLTFVPRLAGPYAVRVSPRSGDGEPIEVDELAFAVNLDPAESDLTPIPKDELLGLLAPGNTNPDGTERPQLDAPERRIGVWGLVLFLVTLVLLAETILGTRRSILLKLWQAITGKKPDADVELAKTLKR